MGTLRRTVTALPSSHHNLLILILILLVRLRLLLLFVRLRLVFVFVFFSSCPLCQAMNPNAVNRTEAANLGQMFMAINPAAFGVESDSDNYAQRMAKLSGQLRGLPQADDAPGPVLVPGDKEAENARQALSEGVSISDKVSEALVALGQGLGVAMPAPTARPT